MSRGHDQFDRLFPLKRAPANALAVDEIDGGGWVILDFHSRLIRASFATEQEAEIEALKLYGRTFETFERDRAGNYIPGSGHWDGSVRHDPGEARRCTG